MIATEQRGGRMLLLTILGSATCGAAASTVFSGAYDVEWLTPSANITGSMPLGGAAGASLNLWAEPGGHLLLMLSHSDSVDESGRLLKLGLLNVSISPSPWGSASLIRSFAQRLHVANGSVTVRGNKGSFVATVFVEAIRPVVRIEVSTADGSPVAISARLRTWRPTVGNESARQAAAAALEAQFRDSGPPCRFTSATPDVLVRANEGGATPALVSLDHSVLQLYHRNAGGNATQFAASLEAQGLGSARGQLVEDPLADLTWGVLVGGMSTVERRSTRWRLETSSARDADYDDGPMLCQEEPGSMTCASAPPSSSRLSSPHSTRHSLVVATRVTKERSAASWAASCNTELEAALVPGAATAAMRSTADWWAANVWRRSHIDITTEAAANGANATNTTGSAYLVSQRNALQRFMEVASARGRDPMRFDGLAFTFSTINPDQRISYRNGGANWWQNIRFGYYSLQSTEAPELMAPIFDMYSGETSLTLAQAKAQRWFGHSGAIFHETMHRWGILDNDDYGCDRTFGGTAPPRPMFEVDNGCIHRHYTGGLEICAMALAQHAMYPNSTFLRDTALPLCHAVLLFYSTHYTGTRDTGSNGCAGGLVLFPAQALERWQSVINPAPDVAGLHRCVLSMLALDSPTELNTTERTALEHLKARLPPLFVGTGPVPTAAFFQGNIKESLNASQQAATQTLWPAQGIAFGEGGGESPQLYSVFPYGLFPNRLDTTRNGSVAVNGHSVPAAVAEATIAYTLNPVGGSGRGGGAKYPQWECNIGWCQDVLFQVGLGLAAGACGGRSGYGMAPWEQVLGRFREGTRGAGQQVARFPVFWDHVFDGAPELDHGSVARIALAKMLLQWEVDRDSGGQKLFLLSAWPLQIWPAVEFKLPAPNNTVVEGVLAAGKVLKLTLTPQWRRADVVAPPGVELRFTETNNGTDLNPARNLEQMKKAADKSDNRLVGGFMLGSSLRHLKSDDVGANESVSSWGTLASAVASLTKRPLTKTVTFTLGTGFTMTGYNGTAISIPEGYLVRIVSRANCRAVVDAGSKGTLFIADGFLIITGITLKNSLAKSNGGVLTVDAGGSAVFADCVFVNNRAPNGDGGVAHVHPNGSASFMSCSFDGNSAKAGGGAVDVYKGSARFVNCSFKEDRAGSDLRFNGVYNGGRVIFGCPVGTTGADVALKGNANTSQLPPAKEVVSCHDAPLECTSATDPVYAMWPKYHPMNNVTNCTSSTEPAVLARCARHANVHGLMIGRLNDANAITEYRGIYHLMMQEGGGIWSHMVSNDLVRWYHIQDALPSGVNMSFPDHGPCDGTMSYPDLGESPYNGSVPVIVYDAACGTPLPKNMTPPSGPFSKHKIIGDVARLEVARPHDPSDPYLSAWHKTQPGPIVFKSLPCAFPSRVWRAANRSYWNMLCDIDGMQPWARYISRDASLMTWELADRQFTRPIAVGGYDYTNTGIMFELIPNSAPGGPTHMINGNWSNGNKGMRHDVFYLGKYDPVDEVFNIDMQLGPQFVESGLTFPPGTMPAPDDIPIGAASWAVAGHAQDGRLLSVAWVSDGISGIPPSPHGWDAANVASLVRELLYDHSVRRLVQRPVIEYELLREDPPWYNQSSLLVPRGGLKTLSRAVPIEQGDGLDVLVSFDVSKLPFARGATRFGVAVRAPPTTKARAAVALSFNVSAADGRGDRLVHAYGVQAVLEPIQIMFGETLDVRILTDRPIIEVFIAGGRAVFVETVPDFTLAATSVHLFNDGDVPVSVSNAAVFTMGCGWTSELPTPRNRG